MDAPDDIPFSIEQCSYRHLQQLAKSLSLPSNVKKVYLIEMIYAKKNYTAERLASIVTHIKEERKQTAKPRKVNKRNKKKIQGTEISSTTENSPPICTTPTAVSKSIRTNRKHHNILKPLIAKRNVESDRVLRSHNNKLRRNAKYIVNYNNNVVGVPARYNVNEVQETRYECNMELQSYRHVSSDATTQRQSSVQTDHVVRQPKPVFVDFNQTNFDPRERQLVPVNDPSGSAKRERRLSGIYPLEAKQPCYQALPGVGYRNQDGRLSSIKALVQKTTKTSQQNITNSQIAQTLVRKRLIQKPIVVSLKSALRPKVIKNRDAVDHFNNSSTESAGERSNDREFAPKIVTNKSFQETFDNVTLGENRSTLIRDSSIENARKQAEVQKSSNAINAANNTVNKKQTSDVHTQMYAAENQTRRTNTEAYGSENQNWPVRVERIETGNNTAINQKAVVYAPKQSIQIDKTNATYNQTMRTNSQKYGTEKGTNTKKRVYSSRSATNNNVDKNRADTKPELKKYAAKEVQKYSNAINAANNQTVNKKQTWGVDTQMYATENQTGRTNTEAYGSENQNWRVDVERTETGNNTWRNDNQMPALGYQTERSDNETYALENRTRRTNNKAYAPGIQSLRQNNHPYAIDNRPRRSDNETYVPERQTWSINNKTNPKPNLAKRLDYDAYATETQRREANKIYAIYQRAVVYAQKQSIPIDKTNATYNQTMRTNSQKYGTEKGTTTKNRVYSSRSATNNDVDKNRADTESQLKKYAAKNFGNKNDKAYVINTNRTDNGAYAIDISEKQTVNKSTEIKSIQNQPNRGGNKNQNVVAPTNRDEVDYPNMSAFTDINVSQNEMISQASTGPSDSSTEYYHEKISAERVTTQRLSASKESQPTISLPHITEVFSQFNDPKFNNLARTYVDNEVDMTKEQYSTDDGPLESTYNYKASELEQPYFHHKISAPDTFCVYNTHTTTTAVAGEASSNPEQGDTPDQHEEQCNVVSESIPQLDDYLFDDNDKCDVAQCVSTMPRLENYLMDSQDDARDDVFARSPLSDEFSIEDALELISQDGDFMERIGMDVRMQCVLCDWAGPKGIMEYHIRHEHQSVIVPRSTSTWSTSISLGSARAGSRTLSELHAHIYVLTVAWVGNNCRAHITTLPNDFFARQKFGRLTVYNKTTGEPHTWQGLIPELSDSPDEDEIKGLTLDLSTLNLLPNSANIKWVNGEWVMNSSSKVVVGPLELNDIEIEVHVEILD